MGILKGRFRDGEGSDWVSRPAYISHQPETRLPAHRGSQANGQFLNLAQRTTCPNSDPLTSLLGANQEVTISSSSHETAMPLSAEFPFLPLNEPSVRASRTGGQIMRSLGFVLLIMVFAVMSAGCAGLVSQVNSPTPVAPSIMVQPINQMVVTGQTATFSVAAAGTAPLSHQWRKNGAAISGATSSSYTAPATTSSDNGAQFTVVVSNTVGSATSSPATLTVNAAPVAPSITTQPTSQTVTTGLTATFNVTATGTAPLSYQWRKNNVAISGATSSSYTTPATTTSDSGATFVVVVGNTAGTVTSVAATLTVNAATVAPSISTQPTSQTVTAGQTATFSAAATGTAPLSYQWRKSGVTISGATSASYTTLATTSSDNGAQFTVLVSNSVGSVTSNAATLTVNAAPVPPSITAQPTSQTVTAGQTATFSVAATGSAPLSYQWRKSGVTISGATSATYTTLATTSSDNGTQFTVLVSNTAGNVTSSAATLTVNAAPVLPSITAQPTSQTVMAGQTATFSVAATGTAPLSYQWRKNNVAISGATSSSYTTLATTTSDSGATFVVVVGNTAGTVTSVAATLTVNAATVAPSISTQPTSQTVTAGQTATFSVAATGSAPLSYQWRKSGVTISGATSASYTTPATSSSDNGAQFTVLVSNSVGSVTSNAATLTVNVAAVAPAITTQPTSQTVTAGQTATFNVAATGSAPLSYQWRKSGVTISGAASATYTTLATTSSDNGAQFTVLVSNTAGNVTSSAATLTVNTAPVPPSITAQPTSQTVTAGQAATFNVTATGTAPLSYQWQKNGAVISGATSTSYTTPAAATTDNGTQFTVVVSNTAGSVTSNAANLTVTSSAVFPVWVSPGLSRVGQTDVPGTTSSINLSGARGETVDAQVIVQGPAGGLTNVNLSASALTGPGGVTIPASGVTLYREHYITVTGTANYGGGSNPPQGSGTYAEPLIPFNDPETGSSLCGTSAVLKACNASVSAGQNQPYWIDISVPHGVTITPPGTYTGSISITTAQGDATVPVTLTVWNFELPAQPSELSLWTLWPPAAGNTTTTLAQALMRNKVMGWFDAAANAPSDITNLGLNRSGLDSYYFIGIQCSGSFSSIPSTSQINAAAANFPAGLGLDFYVADELIGCSSAYSALKTMGTNAHAANRSVKTMMTLNTPDPNLFNEGDGRSAIDHWVLLDSVQQWPALPFTGGGDLWSYTSCNAGPGNAPEWMMDYPPINERIQAGFLNWTQGATGILYYRSDGWLAGNTLSSWNSMDMLDCGGFSRPGDGIFVYPPGPIASTESAPGIRLKAIRDGIQDYEYAQILKNLAQVPFVNSVLQPVASSWSNWTHSPSALEAARLQLGQLLHQLAP